MLFRGASKGHLLYDFKARQTQHVQIHVFRLHLIYLCTVVPIVLINSSHFLQAEGSSPNIAVRRPDIINPNNKSVSLAHYDVLLFIYFLLPLLRYSHFVSHLSVC